MTPADFYKKPPIRKSRKFWDLETWFDYDELGEFDPDEDMCPEKDRPFEVRYYIDHQFDHRRILVLASVWWKEKPVAICAKGGREGGDYEEVAITDKARWDEMLAWVLSFDDSESPKDPRVWDEESELACLEKVYGRPVEAFYDPERTEVEYEVGDIVAAEVRADGRRRGHHKDSEIITTRCEITKVHPYNPVDTYSVRQLDRFCTSWTPGLKRVVADRPGEGNVNSYVSFEEVKGYWEDYKRGTK